MGGVGGGGGMILTNWQIIQILKYIFIFGVCVGAGGVREGGLSNFLDKESKSENKKFIIMFFCCCCCCCCFFFFFFFGGGGGGAGLRLAVDIEINGWRQFSVYRDWEA